MSHVEANLFGWLNILYDHLQNGQKTIRNFTSLIAFIGMIKPVIRTEPLWHGIQTSQECASCMVSECHCCQGSFLSEEIFLGSEKNEINFNNLKWITCPSNLFQVAFIGFCHLAIRRDQCRKFSIILPRAKSWIYLSFFLKFILYPPNLPIPTVKKLKFLLQNISAYVFVPQMRRQGSALKKSMEASAYREGRTEAWRCQSRDLDVGAQQGYLFRTLPSLIIN